jgi:hypothetical protein
MSQTIPLNIQEQNRELDHTRYLIMICTRTLSQALSFGVSVRPKVRRYCGGHIGTRDLAAKVFLLQGFYWPTVIDDAAKLISTCKACQKFSSKTKAPTQLVQLISLS